MAFALESLIGLRPDAVRRFLRAALALERVELVALVAAGVPHYEASELRRRLEQAGELSLAGWQAEARAAYAALLLVDDPARPARRLARMSEAERPREKALRSGIGVLEDRELL